MICLIYILLKIEKESLFQLQYMNNRYFDFKILASNPFIGLYVGLILNNTNLRRAIHRAKYRKSHLMTLHKLYTICKLYIIDILYSLLLNSYDKNRCHGGCKKSSLISFKRIT